MKYNKVILPIVLSMALLTGILVGVFFDFPAPSMAIAESSQRENKIRQILNYIDFEYVENVNTDSILDITIADLLRKLDPHSVYIPEEQVAATEETVRGSFEGIGIEFKIFKDTLTVIRTIEGGPSARAGIKAGDRILMAAEKPMYGNGLSSKDVIATLKGEAGSRVSLAMYHPIDKSQEVVSVKRGKVPISSVEGAFMLNDSTAYIKLLRFSQTSGNDFDHALRQVLGHGVSHLVVDLRDNPGGLLSAAREIADEFLEDEDLIVFTKNREGEKNMIHAGKHGSYKQGGLVILINEGSASASEIVAGAVQDNDRGWIVGRKSFGKGLVQEEMTLNDGSKVRLTTRRYYTPSGRSIQKPYTDYSKKYLEKRGYKNGEVDAASDSLQGSHIYRTLAGRPVFGGGGIQPDFEVGLDTSRAGVILYHLGAMANIDEKAFMYVDENRAAFNAIPRDEFMEAYQVSDSIMVYFFGSNAAELEKYNARINELLRARIKAYLGYYIYGNSAFQQAYATYDPMIQEALRVFKEEGYKPGAASAPKP